MSTDKHVSAHAFNIGLAYLINPQINVMRCNSAKCIVHTLGITTRGTVFLVSSGKEDVSDVLP